MRFYSRHAYYWAGQANAQAAQNSYLALYNSSAIGNILRVRYFLAVATAALPDVRMGFIKGQLSTVVSAGFPFWPDQTATCGIASAGFSGSVPTPQGSTLVFGLSPQGWSTELPLWYVQPGFSLVFQLNSPNTVFIGGWMWEELPISMLDKHEYE